MVGRGLFSFLREEAGAVLAEGLMVIPIVMLIFGVFIEFGYAMVQLDQTVKAMAYGARKLAVSDSVNDAFDPATAAAGDGTNAGDTVPVDAAGPWTCTGTAADPDPKGVNPPCNSELNRIVYGSTGAANCAASTGTAMCRLNPRIKLSNVTVTYSLSGLGYYGRPAGAVVTITIWVNLPFSFPILGTILGLNDITIPATPVTITSEDLSDTS
jgi:hypothetical protein